MPLSTTTPCRTTEDKIREHQDIQSSLPDEIPICQSDGNAPDCPESPHMIVANSRPHRTKIGVQYPLVVDRLSPQHDCGDTQQSKEGRYLSDQPQPPRIPQGRSRNRRDYTEFGRWLKTHRRALGLTQTDVAKASGVSKQYISNLETGVAHYTTGSTYRPSETIVDNLARAVGGDIIEARRLTGYDPRLGEAVLYHPDEMSFSLAIEDANQPATRGDVYAVWKAIQTLKRLLSEPENSESQ